MKIIVSGSRTFEDSSGTMFKGVAPKTDDGRDRVYLAGRNYNLISDWIDFYISVLNGPGNFGHKPAEIIQGLAVGVDLHAKHYAIEKEIPYKDFPVTDKEWKIYGTKAGHIRNVQMADYLLEYDGPKFVLAFIDVNNGRGTKGMIDVAYTKRIPFFVVSSTPL